ncbi:hypothetical protein BKA04_001915 [Cryobacterium mesophilum]|uniref:Uncharacterized protein n=1 Tax=Terrimesophilobacter mesophilus TaxID=433647 RepID=A0A4R8VAT9_9MICO|nr:hypothetical protein [Terrimesophilobacter mesophilus]MBB5633692.1 hypothetical protein [Terrimesophilobacter mesophilus]TFB80381.1 hypothetical protein E3N84_10285 [Terrimesophilobacter mesophilus]
MAAVSAQKMSDPKLAAATGRRRTEWHALLDAAGASVYSTARWKADGGTTVAAISEPRPGKTIVSLTRSRIIDGDSLEDAKAELRRALDALGASGVSRRVG